MKPSLFSIGGETEPSMQGSTAPAQAENVVPDTSGVTVEALQGQVDDLSAENQALRSELAAFDPQFWEEIEDLKYERQQLVEKLARYETAP